MNSEEADQNVSKEESNTEMEEQAAHLSNDEVESLKDEKEECEKIQDDIPARECLCNFCATVLVSSPPDENVCSR